MPKSPENAALWHLYVSSPELTLGNLRVALKHARDLEDKTISCAKSSLLPAVLNMALQLMPKSLLDILRMGPRSLSVHPTYKNGLAVELPYHGGEKHILLGAKDYRCCPLLSLAIFLETRVEPPRGCQELLFAVQDLKNVENLRSFVIGHLDNAFGASSLWFKSFDKYLAMVAMRKGVDQRMLNARRSWKSKSAETFDLTDDVEVALALAVHGPIEYVIDKREAARFTDEWICDNIVPNMVAAGIDRGVAAILGRTILYASLEAGPGQLLHDELREDIISMCSRQGISSLNPVERSLFEVGSSSTKATPSMQHDEKKAKGTNATDGKMEAVASPDADSEANKALDVGSTTTKVVEATKVLAMTAKKTSVKKRSAEDDVATKTPKKSSTSTRTPTMEPAKQRSKTTIVTDRRIEVVASPVVDSELIESHDVGSMTTKAIKATKVLAMTAKKNSVKKRSAEDDVAAKTPKKSSTSTVTVTKQPAKKKAKTTIVTDRPIEVVADSEQIESHDVGSTTTKSVEATKVLVMTAKKTSVKKRSAEDDVAAKTPKKSSTSTRTPTMEPAKQRSKTTIVTDRRIEVVASPVVDSELIESHDVGSMTTKAIKATKVLAMTAKKNSVKKRSAEDDVAAKTPKKSSTSTVTVTKQPAKKKAKTTIVTDRPLEVVASPVADSEANKSLDVGSTTTKASTVTKVLARTDGKTSMNKGSADENVAAKNAKRTSLRTISAEGDVSQKKPNRTSSRKISSGDDAAAKKFKEPKDDQNSLVATSEMDKVILVRDELLKNLDEVVNVFVSLKSLIASLGSSGSIEGTVNVPRQALVDVSSETGDSGDGEEATGTQNTHRATAFRRKMAPVPPEVFKSEPKGDGKKPPSLARKLPAKLSTRPGSLERLWDEYCKGLGGNKPAESFTEEEKKAPGVCAAYSHRSGYWHAMEKLLEVKQKGMTPQVALAEIERCYFPLNGKLSLAKKLDFIYVDQRKGFEKLNKVIHALESVSRKEG